MIEPVYGAPSLRAEGEAIQPLMTRDNLWIDSLLRSSQ